MDYDIGLVETRAREQAAEALGADGGALALERAAAAGVGEATASAYRALAICGYWERLLAPRSCERDFALLAVELEAARHSASLCLSLQATRLVVEALVATGGAGAVVEAARQGGFVGGLCGADTHGVTASGAASGSFVLQGEVAGVINAPIADMFLVTAQGGAGAAAFLVPAGAAGVAVGPRARTGGVCGAAIADVTLTGVKLERAVPFASGDSAGVALDLALAVNSAGLMGRVFSQAREFCGSASRGGRPLMADQAVRYRLAELLTMAQAAEYLARRAVWLRAQGDAEQAVLARTARVFCAESACALTAAALQLAGVPGCAAGSFFERACRDAEYLAVAGTPLSDARVFIADALAARYAG